jgi:hypothetical protein
MTLPRLFSDKGALITVDPSKFDAPTRARYDAIVAAYRANANAEAELKAAFDEVQSALEGVKNTEAYADAHWPKQTFQDLWKENFGGGPHKRMGLA